MTDYEILKTIESNHKSKFCFESKIKLNRNRPQLELF